MDGHGLPEALRSIMGLRGWSQLDLARELGVSQSWVSQASRGMRDPGIARTERLLSRVGWEVRISPISEDDPVRRREFVAAAASITFVPSPKVGPYQDPGYVRQLAERLAHDRYQQGGIPVVSTALRHLRKVGPAINGSDRALQEASSGLACEAARVLYDSRRYAAAEQTGVFALDLARRSGSTRAQADAYSALSRINIDQRRGDRGAMYARLGLRLGDLSPDRQAWLRLRLGRSLALVPGRERAAREVLEEALAVDGLPTYETSDMLGNVGVAMLGMREHDGARATIAEAVRLGAQCSALLFVAYQAWEVEAALRADNASMAADRMTALARIAPLVSSVRVNTHIADVYRLSGRWAGLPEMRDAREQLRSVMRA
jgi:transcriptional regulator with XRE-family HTH domain